MAWDTEATRRRLLDAGARQFAAHGFAGARMDAIGRDSGINKERVYQYFGDKRGLYDAALADQLGRLLEGVDVVGSGPEAVGDYAGRIFDRFREDPTAARMLAWESLELDAPAAAERRGQLCSSRAAAMRVAIPGLRADAAAELLLSVVTLAAGWWTLRHLAAVVIGEGISDEQRRSVIVAQAAALAAGADVSAHADPNQRWLDEFRSDAEALGDEDMSAEPEAW